MMAKKVRKKGCCGKSWGHTVLLVNVNILIIRYDSKDGNMADCFQHFSAFVKQTEIASKLIDDDTLNALPVNV